MCEFIIGRDILLEFFPLFKVEKNLNKSINFDLLAFLFLSFQRLV